MPERACAPSAAPGDEPAAAPGPGAAGEPAGRPKRRRWPLALLALGLLLVAAAAGVWLWQASQPGGMEPNVIVGPMGECADEEIEATLRDRVEEGMIAFSINTQVILEGPGAPAPLLFENPGNNGKLLRLVLVRDDTGEAVYETGLIAPGTYVDEDALDARLEPGTYACTATVSAYRQDTRAPLGEAAAEVVVTVLDGADR